MLSRLSWGRAAIAAGPALVTAYLSFNAGGFFAGAPAVAATALGLALVLRILVAEEPFAGFGPAVVIAATALGLYGAWTLVSSSWSDAAARAMIDFDRVMLCWFALVLFGSFPRDRQTMVWAVRALAATIVAVALAGLATRLLPDVWEARSVVEDNRLSFPLTYWNALGVLVASGIVLCAHLASAAAEPRLGRALAAAALPALSATLFFTFSRGGIVAAGIGLLVYAIVARPRGLLSAALAVVPPTVVLMILCYRADLLAGGRYASADGVAQGHDIALAVAAAALIAGLVRVALDRTLDPALERARLPRARSGRGAAVAAGLAVLTIAAAVAIDLPSKVSAQYESFTADSGVDSSIDNRGDLRERFTATGNNGRLDQWRVALDTFAAEPLTGEGAGTFARVWARDGTDDLKVEDAHSLYLEVLAELGLPGLLLIGTAILALLVGVARATRGPGSEVYAAVLAAGVAWALHAGVDWDWEMPATGLWLFALGGLALARPPGAPRRLAVPGRVARLVLATGCLAVIATPALMALSQARLNSSVEALKDNDCATAATDALAAARWVPPRPEPFQILAFCNSRVGDDDLAIQMANAAVSRDPESWDSHYALALVQAAAGVDPRPAARRALELSPNAVAARQAVRRFDTDDPREWRRRALNARLPIF